MEKLSNKNLKRPDRLHDFEVGDKRFWFEEMIVEVQHLGGGSQISPLSHCPVTNNLMMWIPGLSVWKVYPDYSCTMQAYNEHYIEKLLFGG